ncbi:MAG TPA: fumarylacetoacetate hydrolase family protein [Acetobacteraceae bacterium]|nr:fumarylacetoacetate hydrolase family protein [Acetobacteraceae bacterium]
MSSQWRAFHAAIRARADGKGGCSRDPERESASPGDLLAIGTPPGVGFGKNRYMAVGDVLECGIANLGAQRHEIQA